MSFYRPDSLLAAVNPLCKSIDLNGITPEKEEFQARVWKVLFKFIVLHCTNVYQHSGGPPLWQGRSVGSLRQPGCVQALTQSRFSAASLAEIQQLATGSSSSRTLLLQGVQGSQFATV